MKKSLMMVVTFLLYVSFTNLHADAEEIRISGVDRYETAVKISKAGWDKSDTVVLATGSNFPDALAGGPLAYQNDAPILLTKKDALHMATREEIERLEAEEVIILGGTGVISADVVEEIVNMGITVRRIVGKDRYETAALIASELDNKEDAILAYGKNFPDALAIAPYAARNNIPILLTDTDQLHPATESVLEDRESTIIVGGEKIISPSIKNQVPGPNRISGKDRYATAASIMEKLQPHVQSVYLSTGQAFPDSLSGAVLAAKQQSGILLSKSGSVPSTLIEFLDRHSFHSVTTLGGKQAISEDTKESIETINRLGSTALLENPWSPFEKTHYDPDTNAAVKDELWVYHKGTRASKQLKIGKEDSGMGTMQMVGETIYFSLYEYKPDGSFDYGVRSIKVDGKGERVVLPKISTFYVIKNRIYGVTTIIEYGLHKEKIISEYTLDGKFVREVYRITNPYYTEMIVRNGFFYISERDGEFQEINKIDPLNGEVSRIHEFKLEFNQSYSLYDVNRKDEVVYSTFSDRGTILYNSAESNSLRLDGEWVFEARYHDKENVITISHNDEYDPSRILIHYGKKDGKGRRLLGAIPMKNNQFFKVIDISEHHVVYQLGSNELRRMEF